MAGIGRASALVMALALAGCSSTTSPDAEVSLPRASATPTPSAAAPTSGPTPRPAPSKVKVRAQAVSAASLVPFASCSDLLTRVKREALAQVTAYGLPGGGAVAMDGIASTRAAAPSAAGAADTSAQAFSPTNNQEAGVDEADIVKTDGRLMVVLRQGDKQGVQVVDVRGTPRLRGFLPLPQGMYGGQLLLVDGRAVLVGTGRQREGGRYRSWTHVLVISLADPDHPKVEREFDVDGSTQTVREIGGRVLLVTQSGADIIWAYPAEGTKEAQSEALRENRRRIRSSSLRAWLPSVTSLRTGRSYVPACQDGLRSQSASGTSTTTLVSIDPASDVPGTQAMVEGSSAVVYASTRSVYVTTWPWEAQTAGRGWDEQDLRTNIHRFDVSDPARPMYSSSGSVPGTLIGQYAMSEHEGNLRVASTLGRTWAMQDESVPPSDNLVTVLGESGKQLVKVGQVRGLGRGERIYGVRFMGALGYVVTFRQTDPLYVVDLADPTRPSVRGELHVTGYSSYLHPLGAGMLLGIGQEVKDNRRVGTQVSTFDVSDAEKPTLRDREHVPNGSSSAEHDPHSVLWWPGTRDLVVPLSEYDPEGSGSSFEGALVLHVGAKGGLVEVGRIEHPSASSQDPAGSSVMRSCCWGGILRTVVVGDLLLTLSERGVLASELGTLEDSAWLPYR